MENTTVAIVGVGTMGSQMAERLSDRFDVIVADANADVATRVADRIHGRAALLEDLGDVHIVVLMLPHSDIVDAVVGRLLPRLASGATIIDMSSSDPHRTRALAERASERGIGFVDAPVSGGPMRAGDGSLSIMVGGDVADVALALPVLERLGSRIRHIGPSGAGHASKALNNLLAATNLAATSEVLSAGRSFGLKVGTLIDVINSSSGASTASSTLAEQISEGRFAFGFTIGLMAKDVAIARSLFDEDLPVTTAAGRLWADAASADATADMTTIVIRVDPLIGGDRHETP